MTSPQSSIGSIPIKVIHPKKIYARSVKGVFDRWRVVFLYLTQIIFYGAPWLQWNGRQALWFDLTHRKFYLFGSVFGPEDIILLAFLLIVCAYSLFLVTTVAGRLWCGFTCPQSVYSKLFMWIEKQVQGDRSTRMALDRAPWGMKKIRLVVTKHFLWLVVALWTGITFVGYFSPIDELALNVAHLNVSQSEFLWISLYSLATWGNAGFLREKVCLHMCPYARFQSVMFDADTFTVTYDTDRGEPRGPRASKSAPLQLGQKVKGDCIDCSLCVQVCPVGIDIRNGLQYECISCGACIDACDSVMEKVGLPKGLIRYSSLNANAAGKTWRQMRKVLWRPRVLGYAALGVLMFAALFYVWGGRAIVKIQIEHDRGALFVENTDGSIDNVYSLKLSNYSEQPLVLQFSVAPVASLSTEAPIQIVAPLQIELAPLESRVASMTLRQAVSALPPVIEPGQKMTTAALAQTVLIADREGHFAQQHSIRFLRP